VMRSPEDALKEPMNHWESRLATALPSGDRSDYTHRSLFMASLRLN
jgi:hypothetical protein